MCKPRGSQAEVFALPRAASIFLKRRLFPPRLAGLRSFAYVLFNPRTSLLETLGSSVSQIAKNWIVETDWLQDHLSSPDIIILDGSWHLPTEHRDARKEFMDEHIPGAMFFDIDDLSDESSPLPHMLPSTVKFASRMKKMGIGDGAHIVVYDTTGIFSAARVWWTFRAMGHRDVSVLNGGLKKWKAEGRPIEDGQPLKRSERHYTPRQNTEIIRDLDEMRSLLKNAGVQIVDARPAGRFEGKDPEPRPGLRGGHIPGSKNIPSQQLLNGDGTYKSPGEIETLFRNAGIDVSRPVVTTCGSGVTASMLALALAVVGQTNAAVYDGSWAEWGQENGLPVEKGPAA
jgi:thiosulfate/3-mercaptopyruvate sulfurtransferase